jgi:hypothetical protein
LLSIGASLPLINELLFVGVENNANAFADNSILATAIPKITTVFPNSLKDVGWYGSSVSIKVGYTSSRRVLQVKCRLA